MKIHDLSDFIDIPKEYYTLAIPKQRISQEIRNSLKKNNLSIRKAASKIDGMSYPQIARITSGENYNIETLLKVLDVLNLEIVIKEKS